MLVARFGDRLKHDLHRMILGRDILNQCCVKFDETRQQFSFEVDWCLLTVFWAIRGGSLYFCCTIAYFARLTSDNPSGWNKL
jgi:hypothetical protein